MPTYWMCSIRSSVSIIKRQDILFKYEMFDISCDICERELGCKILFYVAFSKIASSQPALVEFHHG